MDESALRGAIFDTITDAIVCSDARGRIVLFNPAAQSMFGYSWEEVRGRNVSLLMAAPDQAMHDRYIERYQETGESRIDHKGRELLAARRDGECFHAHVALSHMSHEGRTYYTTVIRDISARKAIENALAESEAKYRTLFEAAPEGVWLIDPELKTTQVNRQLCLLLGYDPEEMLGKTPMAFADDANRRILLQETAKIPSTLRRSYDIDLRHKDGHNIPCHLSAATLRNRDGSVYAALAFVTDLTERKLAEARIREEREFLQTIIDGVSDPIMVISTDYAVLTMNRAARQSAPALLPGQQSPTCHFVSHKRDTPCCGEEHPCPLQAVIQGGQPVTVVHKHQSPTGPRDMEISASPLWGPDGALVGIVEVSRDVTNQLKLLKELSQQEAHMDNLAHHDPLTGLPNRLLLSERLEQEIGSTQHRERAFSVLFMDLDRFKEINDSFGHDFGDKLLQLVAERLRRVVRDEDTVARHGGDEFVILLRSYCQGDETTEIARRLIEQVQRPFLVDGQELYVTATLGISYFPNDGTDPDTLLRNADAAMYRAKENGRNTFAYYTPDITDQAYERVVLAASLRHALNEDGLRLHYQPQFDLASMRLCGLEALVRWHHPQMGPIEPERFIPVAEETGLILPLGSWVLQTACHQWTLWRDAGLDIGGRLAVNLSAKQLDQPTLVQDIKRILEATGCPPQALELEITEGTLMRDPQCTGKILMELRDLGFDIAIDDFGTGYSSLIQLKRLPITKLKIDASFVQGIPEDTNDTAITTAIIAMALGLGLNLVAEGVESEQQREFLMANDCRQAQGYLFSRPLEPARIEAFIRSLPWRHWLFAEGDLRGKSSQ